MQILLMFLRANARRLVKYAGVSLIGVVNGQALLWLFHAELGWAAAISNILAVTIATFPNYLLNRAWVWGKIGGHSMSSEVVPFWGMAFIGLLVSTVLVQIAESRFESWVFVNLANIAGFGMLWVARFFVLDRVLFKHEPAPRSAVESPV